MTEHPAEPRPFRRNDDVAGYETFAEARSALDAVAVLFGDYGGTIYLTAPMRFVRCTEAQLLTLHSDLDAITWMGGDGFAAAVSYERHPVPTWLSGGDGGADVVEGVWVHDTIDPEVAAFARDVVGGTRDRLPASVLHGRRSARLAELHTRRQLPDTVQFLADHGLAWDHDVLDPVVPFPDV